MTRSCMLAMLLASLASSGCAPMSFLVTPVAEARELREFEVQRDDVWTSRRIAVIDVDGVIATAAERSMFGGVSENPVATFKEKLDAAARDARVKAIVVRINSPGGGVTASDIMYRELAAFRKHTGKKAVAAMIDVAASGGYYLACAADKIYAMPSTITGSIGVIMMSPDLSGTLAKIGARWNVVKSGELKDAGSPFREMSERDRAVFQGLIDSMYESFLDVVRTARPSLSDAELRKLADGRVYLGSEAKKNGLIDELGSLDDAIAAAKTLAGFKADDDFVIVSYGRPYSHKPNIYATGTIPSPSAGSAPLINLELPTWLREGSPSFLYLWIP